MLRRTAGPVGTAQDKNETAVVEVTPDVFLGPEIEGAVSVDPIVAAGFKIATRIAPSAITTRAATTADLMIASVSEDTSLLMTLV